MSSPSDPFSARFDSIEIDPARVPSKAALDHAFALVAPKADDIRAEAPGFYLLDDGGGRFEIDREFGVISLRDESILAREPGAIHPARLRVVEQSGATYEMELQLRLTGRIPQMVGGENFSAIAGLPPEAPLAAAPALPLNAVAPSVAWTRYAAAQGLPGKAAIARTRRAFIVAELPAATALIENAALSLNEPLPQVGLPTPWSL